MNGYKSYPIWSDTRRSHKAIITPFIAEGATTAVVVCPGGSYFWLDEVGEGYEVGEWLKAQGISAFVLHYSVPGWWAWSTHYRCIFRGRQHPDMYNDGQQALTWVHHHAAQYGINTNQIGIMGFSAGGHLAMHEACTQGTYRPAFVAAIYPVVTMTGPHAHRRSRRGLMGEWKQFDTKMRTALSLEQNIPENCPPVFIANCVDDPVVDYRNSELLDKALSQHNIPHKYIQYREGRHGFGVSELRGSPECRQWKYEFIHWLKNETSITKTPQDAQ